MPSVLPPPPPRRVRGPPPPLPPRWTRPNVAPVYAQAASPDVIKAIARPPPPPQRPKQDGPATPPLPLRRLPPPPASLPTPPPEPHPETYEHYAEEQEEYQHYDNQPALVCIKCRDFTHADAHAALFPRQHITSLPDLAHALTSPFPSETDKARAIFTWLHHNVAYDTTMFFSGHLKPSTAESTLQSGLAVCDGYAG